MSDQTQAALQALIQQVTALTEKVAEQDKRYDDVYRVNGKLLEQLKGPKPADKPAATPTAADYANLLKKLEDGMRPTGLENVRREGDPVTISRSAALDPRKYEAAQKQARELGVKVEMTDDRPSAQAERPATYQSRETDTSMIDTVDDTAQKVRWVRHDVATGGAGLIQNSLAAERDGFRMATFKTDDDLPDAMKTKIGLMASAAGGGDADE
ncbi:MAG: hypothetical protein N4A61_11220 [Pelagimonas sp.]|jgi:hypothetical protein|nr:hypothetical protein [Pelagimonas sp.]